MHLALEVLRLLPRGDAGIDGDRGRRCRRGCCARSTFTPESGDVVQPVLALATSGQQHGWDLSLSSPEAEGAGCDVQDVTGLYRSNPSCIMIRFHNVHLGLCLQFFSLSTTTCLNTPRFRSGFFACHCKIWDPCPAGANCKSTKTPPPPPWSPLVRKFVGTQKRQGECPTHMQQQHPGCTIRALGLNIIINGPPLLTT